MRKVPDSVSPRWASSAQVTGVGMGVVGMGVVVGGMVVVAVVVVVGW